MAQGIISKTINKVFNFVQIVSEFKSAIFDTRKPSDYEDIRYKQDGVNELPFYEDDYEISDYEDEQKAIRLFAKNLSSYSYSSQKITDEEIYEWVKFIANALDITEKQVYRATYKALSTESNYGHLHEIIKRQGPQLISSILFERLNEQGV